ncbi:hypothetical protein [Specibacter sp. NPDC078692]|uniref:hypothetical protein n=1 Tax=Specibacter sp. NPDC078692 TaxID=3155818 RepID=UPI0034213AA7
MARLSAGEAELRAYTENGQNKSSLEERRRGNFLAHIAAVGDVPRYPSGGSMVQSIGPGGADLFYSLFPTASDVTALVILIQCLTGHNVSTICNLTPQYSRADGAQDGEPSVLVTRASKPRRGPFKAEMDLPFTNISEETGEYPQEGARDDYASAFGIYMIAHRLCRRARGFTLSGHLLVSHSFHRRYTAIPNGPGFRPVAENCMYKWDGWIDADDKIQRVDSRRLRRTFLELHQRPVAHSVDTLANTYLSRDTGALASNQAVIQHVLEGEVERIRTTNLSLVLTNQDVEQARNEPGDVATRFGVTPEKLAQILDGRLDTLATACVDNQHGPYTAPEKACTASFLLCLGCPCARSEPRHIPVQALLRQQIEARREELMPEQWQRKFGTAAEQLDDVLAQQRVVVAAAATTASGEDAALIEALLDGRLDLR